MGEKYISQETVPQLQNRQAAESYEQIMWWICLDSPLPREERVTESKMSFHLVKVASLQSDFLARFFFLSYELSYEKCFENFPDIFEPLFCGSEKILQNSCQICHQMSLRKIKKKSPTSFCRSAAAERTS